MEKEIVPYELAVKLKPLGFDEPCFGWYHVNDLREGVYFCYFNAPKRIKNGFDILAPTYSQAFRWFREKYEIMSEIIWISALPTHNTFSGRIKSAEKTEYMVEFDTYEEAELACLNKLIEIVETKLEKKEICLGEYEVKKVELFKQAKEIEAKQKGYTKNDVESMLHKCCEDLENNPRAFWNIDGLVNEIVLNFKSE